ncbi:MAG: hypothetical protein Q8R92_17545 [Deltaproteobacteria bacterium]|nr:hypothetical protein [Deltaproteobacteria bacterium]
MPFSTALRLGAAILCLSLAGCASRALDIVNPADSSPRLAARVGGVTVTGGGTATSRGWDRGLIVSFTLRNEGKQALHLARKDLVLKLGFRRVAAHTLIGSEKSGAAEAVEVPPKGKVDFIAQFSTALGITKKGSILLRVRRAGEEKRIEIEVPIVLRKPPDLEKEPALMDRAGAPPDEDERGG